jgi:hypothetical protein
VDERDAVVAPLLDEARPFPEAKRSRDTRETARTRRSARCSRCGTRSSGAVLRYSPLTDRHSVGGRVYVQRVRSLAQSLEDRAANCVDGSVLMASLLGAVNLDAALVRVPGHMFLQVALDRAGTRHAYLETTLLNDPRVATDPDASAASARESSRRRFRPRSRAASGNTRLPGASSSGDARRNTA